VQRKIADKLNEMYQPYAPKNVMGFIKSNGINGRRDILSNAKKHKKSRYLINIDIKDFFPSCTPHMMCSFLVQKFSFSAEFINLLFELCFLNGSLPPGSPASPILSNIILLPIDNKINHYCKAHDIIYTRYVDDLSFSAKNKISKEQFKSIASIIIEHSFQLNEEKTVFYKKSDIKEVTGIAIDGKKLKLCQSTVDEVTENIAYYHEWKQKILRQFGAIPETREKIAKMQKSIKGQLNFAKRVDGSEGKTYKKLKEKYENSIDEKDFNFKLYI
jgi:RNA-directed DNA polymerase